MECKTRIQKITVYDFKKKNNNLNFIAWHKYLILLDQVCTSAAGILAHSSFFLFSLPNLFSIYHSQFSIGFRSGDWQGHSRTLRCFLQSHSLVALAVCFGLLSHRGKEIVGQDLPIHSPIHHPLNMVQSSCPHASGLLWCSRGCTYHPPSSKHGEWSLNQKALFLSHQTR